MINLEELKEIIPSSPAMIFDGDGIIQTARKLAELSAMSGCKVLYSIKALPLFCILELVKPYLNGFSVSSLFEARLANESLARRGALHVTTPGIRPDEITELSRLCSHISANSIFQLRSLLNSVCSTSSIGVRINPGLSFLEDDRFDPCRPFSKLGVPVESFLASELAGRVKGLHFHTVFGAESYQSLLSTVSKLRYLLDEELVRLDWLNLGGGYLYGQIAKQDEFIALVRELINTHNLEIYVEPGNAIVGKAGHLMATVIDLFTSGGKQVAVLDTSVNHLPEVFEYQRPPELAEHDPEGDYPALLAGGTCLAGDLFGEYRFQKPLTIGSRLVFKNAGAYTLVKAHRFNGHNLPDIFLYNSGGYRLIQRYAYDDFKRQWLNDA